MRETGYVHPGSVGLNTYLITNHVIVGRSSLSFLTMSTVLHVLIYCALYVTEVVEVGIELNSVGFQC